MGKVKDVITEIINLRNELAYYLEYEPENHQSIVEIEREIFRLEDLINGGTKDDKMDIQAER